MIASALFYAGAAVALLGVLLAVLLRRLRGRPRRATGWLVALGGGGVSLVALVLPARDVVVTAPRERLDTLVPRYQFHERHTLAVAADPVVVDRAIRTVTADDIRLYRALTWVRRLGRRGPPSLLDAPAGMPMLTLATRSGFHLLADEPGREIVLGVALPVSPSARAEAAAAVRTHGRRPFIDGADGYATAAMSFRVVPDGRGGSVVSTETRVLAPDAATRQRFARYWRVIYPGSALIRRGWLAAIRRRAESGA